MSKGSNATPGTKQIWVKKPLHMALTLKHREENRTIKFVVEDLLLKGLGVEDMEDLEDILLEQFKCKTLEDLEEIIYREKKKAA